MKSTLKTTFFSIMFAAALLLGLTAAAQAQQYTGAVDWLAVDPSANPASTTKFTFVGQTSLCTSGTYAFISENDWAPSLVAEMRNLLRLSKMSGSTLTINTQFSSGGICHVSYMRLN